MSRCPSNRLRDSVAAMKTFALLASRSPPVAPGSRAARRSTNTPRASSSRSSSRRRVGRHPGARAVLANNVEVKHILIGWKDLQDGRVDERASKRTKSDAEALGQASARPAQGGADFDALMKQYSEDPGSASSGRVYKVSPRRGARDRVQAARLRLKVERDRRGPVGLRLSHHQARRVTLRAVKSLRRVDAGVRAKSCGRSRSHAIHFGELVRSSLGRLAGNPRRAGRRACSDTCRRSRRPA